MVLPLIITGDNLVSSTYNNTFTYTFPQGSVQFKDNSVALASVNIYYSWYNITSLYTYSRYNNNYFQYVWYGTSTTTYDVVIPDGNYEITDINAYLQSVMYSNGQYLTNSSSTNVYYLEFVASTTTGKVQLNSYAVPTSLPSGYTAPSNWPGYPSTATTPQVIIPTYYEGSTAYFNDIIGFETGTYPSSTQTTDYSVTSTSTPQVSVVNSIIMSCNLVNNRLALPNTLLYAFPAIGTSNITFGELVSINPSSYFFTQINDGSYQNITIQLFDQNLDALYVNDSNIVILLLIADNKDKML